MKIAISACGSDYNAAIDPRFGRATYFLIYDDAKQSWQCAGNQQNLEAAKGAGIQAAENIRKLGVHALITGNVGPKAFKVLKTNNVQVYAAFEMTVGEAYEAYKNGRLAELNSENVAGHWS